MKRTILTSMAALLLTAGSMIGHHGYAEYDRNAPVTLEGNLKRVLWANPHVVLTLETQTKGEYSVEWGAVFQLSRQGISAVPVKEGDRLIVTGSINRNPEKRILTLVQEISRPADGWHWVSPNRANASSTTK
ncbi:MAG: hypothetical protein LAO55_08965 [Acidobacteriia bacterium]|nr:hypothetical protein [Terriglobia bacterium]